jgi:hypothetical protein
MPGDEPPPIDRERTEALAFDLMVAVRKHYLDNGPSARQELVYEALNALGVAVAHVIAGTAPFGIEDCLRFFSSAFTTQLNATLQAEGHDTAPGVH